MKRNERIFKKRFKESGLNTSDSDSDSETEAERKRLNQRAFNKWVQRKENQRENDSVTLSTPASQNRGQCLGSLMMVGDTSRGNISGEDNSHNIYAFKEYKRHHRAQSAPANKQSIDPETYEDWLNKRALTAHKTEISNTQRPQTTEKMKLKKKIDYQVWLERANKRLAEDLKVRQKEEQQKKDFEEWIQEIKDEVGTYDYWKRNKEAKLREERKLLRMKQEKQQRKAMEETENKKMLSKQLYVDWVLKKEMKMLQQEEERLREETNRLKSVKESK